MKDFHRRSFAKTISWRFFATVTTIAVVYAFTGHAALSLGVGAVEVVAKMGLYYTHERLWARIGWGRLNHPLQDLPVNRPLTPQDTAEIRDRLQELGYL